MNNALPPSRAAAPSREWRGTNSAALQIVEHRISNVEAEVGVVGAMLIEPKLIDQIARRICGDDFSEPFLGVVFSTILREAELGRPLNPLSIRPFLEGEHGFEDMGGRAWLADLAAQPALIIGATANAEQIAEFAQRRRLVEGLRETIALASDFDQPVAALVQVAEDAITVARGSDSGRAGARLPVELFDEIQPRLEGRWLVKGLLGCSSACVAFGSPGCGKSFLALDLALHVASGQEWFGHRTEPGGVVYVAAEGQSGLRLRVEAWRRSHGQAAATKFALVPAAVDLLDPRSDLAKLAEVLSHLAERWSGIVLLVVDTLAATFGGGDENSGDMAAYVSNVARLCAPHGCARLIIHHSPLALETKRPRGHGSLLGAADSVFHISGDRDAPARRLHVLKQKDCDPGPDQFFKLVPVEIGFDEDGDAVTSCIVERVEMEAEPVAPPARRLSDKQRIAFGKLEQVLVASGRFPPPEIPDATLNRAKIGKVASLSEWRCEALSALGSSDTKPDTARRTFDRAREALQASELIGVWEDWVWLI